jgi:predicted aspartyl protease
MLSRTIALLALLALVAPAALAPGRTFASDRAPMTVDDADRLLLAGEYRKAADAYRDLADAGAPSGDAATRDLLASFHARRAVAFVKRDDVPAAIAAADQAMVASVSADSHAVRAYVRFRAGRFAGAAEDVERTGSLSANGHPLAFLVRARLALSEGRAADALASADKSVAGESILARAIRSDALTVRADALDELGRDREAVASLDAALAAAPRTNELLVANLTAQLEFRRSLLGREIYSVREPAPAVDLPMVFVAGLPVVNMSMNGAPAVPFIVDTGAGISVVFSKYAKQAGFVTRDEPAFAGAVGGNGRVPIRYGLADKVALGDVRVDAVPMIRIDWELPSFGGIIGLPLLRQFRTTFDYPAARLRLENPDGAALTGANKGTARFRLIGQGVFVEATLNGKGPFNFELDTGAASPGVPVDDAVASAFGLNSGAPGVKKGRGQGAAGTQDTAIHPGLRFAWAGLPEAKYDAIVQRISPARADRRDGESGISTDTELEGLIGFAALKTYAVTIDFATRTIVLR